MLESLSIKNLALIKDEKIEFDKGLNVLLGETGSGKSLIFDAISFVLGMNNDKTLLRFGSDQMKVDAFFTDLSKATVDLMENYEIEGDEILITRTLSREGKSNYKINGETVASTMIKNLSKTLLDSLVQHESMDLLKSKNHLIMIDKFGGESISDLKNKLADIYSEKKILEKKIKELGGDSSERERNRDIYSFQLQEIERADLQLNEEDEIRERLNLLSNAEKIYEAVNISDNNLTGGASSALSQINDVISNLNSLDSIENIKDCNDRLISLRYELEDIAETLVDIRRSVNYDEIEYNRLDSRLDLIKNLKKKYGGSVEKVIQYGEEIKNKLDEIDNSEDLINKYTKDLLVFDKKLNDIAEELSNLRKKLAKEIENKVVGELLDLGMKNTIFKVDFKEKAVSTDGKDVVEFIFSANKGQELKNLAKTASGGETSRIMLALKNIFCDIDDVGSLLFDEVDSGISGEIGNMVGKKLLSISSRTQVICITHLPQVASLADNFYLVKKTVNEEETISSTEKISEDEAIYEIARLIGGNNISDIAQKHAIEMRKRK